MFQAKEFDPLTASLVWTVAQPAETETLHVIRCRDIPFTTVGYH
jgi:hypothetical protein